MTPESFDLLVQDTLHEIFKLSKSKGREYTQGSNDRLSNFKKLADEYGVHPLVVWGVYWGKHVDAIKTYVRDSSEPVGREYSESIESRFHDMILYGFLGLALVREYVVEGEDFLIEQLKKVNEIHGTVPEDFDSETTNPYEDS